MSVWYVAGFVNVMYAHVHMDICIKLATDSNVNVVHVLSTVLTVKLISEQFEINNKMSANVWAITRYDTTHKH